MLLTNDIDSHQSRTHRRDVALVIRIIFLLSSVTFLKAAHAQIPDNVYGRFTNIRFPQFVEEIEKKVNYHFYYDPAEMDTVTITIDADQMPLQQFLQKALAGTPYQFSIDSLRNVFIYNKKFQLQT